MAQGLFAEAKIRRTELGRYKNGTLIMAEWGKQGLER